MPPENRRETPADIHRLRQAEVDPDLLARTSRPARRRLPIGILTAIAVGGMGGSVVRYSVGRIIHVSPGSFPWATFAINVSGSFVLGVLVTLIIERWPPSRYVRPLVAIGFLGAYTTFSTAVVEADVLAKDHHVDVAAIYIVTSLVCGLIAVYAGIVLARLRPLSRENP